MPSQNTKEIECTITGKVQGVNFRNFAKEHAEQLGLVGSVQNMSDGSVEIVAQGEEDKLETFIEHLKKGPYFSSVEDIEITWHSTLQDTLTDFTIMR